MTIVLSSKEVDIKLAEIARLLREQFNSFNHNLGRGNDSLMVCADRKLVRLREEWDKTLLFQGVACDKEDCQKEKPISQWKFFHRTGEEQMIEAYMMKCPCCGFEILLSGHSMAARIGWVINHAYALPDDFLPNSTNDINVFYSKTSIPR